MKLHLHLVSRSKFCGNVSDVISPTPRNAIDVLMQSSETISYPPVPSWISARNKKDNLYNAIVHMFEKKKGCSYL